MLLFAKVVLRPRDLTSDTLRSLFARQTEASLCLVFDGFAASCLGYVLHVRYRDGQYEVLNITGESELLLRSEDHLAEVIMHVSGMQYSEAACRAFQKIRTDIGTGVPFADFIGES